MFRHPLLLFSTALLFVLGVLHFLGILYSLYYFFRPLDLIAHFLGGAWVSLMALWFFYFSGFVGRQRGIRELLLQFGFEYPRARAGGEKTRYASGRRWPTPWQKTAPGSHFGARQFIVVLPTVLMLGLVWEVFEIAIGVPLEEGYVFDTLSDLFMDIAGAVVAVCFARWRYGDAEVR